LLVIVSTMICLLCMARHPGLCHNQIIKAYLVFFKRVRALEDMYEVKAMEIGIVDIPREEIRDERNCANERPAKEISRLAGSVS
ncbi:hypothetical protein L873DRAFT_1678160, partial [Choiromyces venosus 120613-1]